MTIKSEKSNKHRLIYRHIYNHTTFLNSNCTTEIFYEKLAKYVAKHMICMFQNEKCIFSEISMRKIGIHLLY